MAPLVSVIIPNYNHAPYLRQRIESVLDQTFQNFELIILDDASTDASWDILKEYKHHPKVSHCIRNEVNSGSPFRQWQKGIALAKGEWIWIAESDDWAEPNLLESLINLAPGPPVPLMHVQSVTHYLERQETTRHFEKTGTYDFNTFIKRFFKFNLFPNASAILFRKASLDPKIWKELESFKFAGDWLFWVHLCLNQQFFYLESPLNHFRKHASSVTSKFEESPLFETEKKRIQNYMIRKGPYPWTSKLKRHLEYWISP